MAVVGVPEGVDFDPARTPLNRDNLARKGITVEEVGEYYHFSTGPKSRYAEIKRRAESLVAERGGSARSKRMHSHPTYPYSHPVTTKHRRK